MPMLSGQVRVGMSGFFGLDMQACTAALQDYGIPKEVSSVWLPFWEQGVIEAMEEKKKKAEEGKK